MAVFSQELIAKISVNALLWVLGIIWAIPVNDKYVYVRICYLWYGWGLFSTFTGLQGGHANCAGADWILRIGGNVDNYTGRGHIRVVGKL